jgi:hypothetical protein
MGVSDGDRGKPPAGPEDPTDLLGPTPIWTPTQLELFELAKLIFTELALRRHPRRQRRFLEKLIREFGFCIPILVDHDNRIIAGELRVLVARDLGMTHVPAVRVKHLTDHQIRALRIADNKLSEMSSFNMETLPFELADLSEIIDIELTGFAVAEVDLLINTKIAKPNAQAMDDCPPARFSAPAVCRPGEVYLCSRHRIGCGDARDSEFLAQLMMGQEASQYLGDIPYNLKIPGNVSGLGKIKHENFVMASGEMSDDEFIAFLTSSIGLAARHCKNGALIYVFIDWRHVHQVIETGLALGLRFFNKCIWTKSNAGMGAFYRSAYEEIVVFKKGDAPHTNNIELGRYA